MLTWVRARLWSPYVTLFGYLNDVGPGPRRPRRIPYPIFRVMRRVAEAISEKHTCPRRREGGAGIWERGDWWETHYNGDRVCSYCGSMDPAQFLEVCRRIGDAGGNATESIEFCKGYKFYVTRPGIRNASEGAIKFYSQHMPRPDAEPAITDRLVLINRALRISSAAWLRQHDRTGVAAPSS